MTERTLRINSGAKPTPSAQKSVARPAATTGSTSSRANSNPNELGKAAAASEQRKDKPDQIVRSAEIEQAQVEKSIGERTRAAPNLGAVSPVGFARMLPELEELVHAFGVRTEAAASGLTLGFVSALGERGAMFRSLVLAMGAEMEPTDVVEAMLVHQIAITHSTMMRASGMAWDAKSIEVTEA